MLMKTKIFFIRIFVCLAGAMLLHQAVQAQRYPVSGSLQLLPPYTASLAQYTNITSGPELRLNITLNDFSLGNLSVKLRAQVQQGGRIIARSADEVIGERSIRLEGGYTQSFSLQDLSHYFQLENLQGIGEEMYQSPLPEGVYEISFTVLDAFTGRTISEHIGQLFPVILNNVPQLYTPGNRENVQAGQFTFQWSPSGSQQSYIRYRLVIKELLGGDNAFEQEFANTAPLTEAIIDEVQLTSLNLPVSLQEGHRYAWQVIAEAKPGFEGLAGGFRTNGMYGAGASNINMFVYQGNCQGINSIQLEARTSDRILASWAPDARYSSYHVQYKKSGAGEWIEQIIDGHSLVINNLEAATLYEVKVGVACGGTEGENAIISYSDPQTIETMAAGEVAGVVCGREPEINLQNEEMISALSPGDEVWAGDFKIVLASVNGNQGGWSGDGYFEVPVLGARLKFNFSDIMVNTARQLVGGYIETAFDVENNLLLDVDEAIDSITRAIEEIVDAGTGFTQLRETIEKFLEDNKNAIPEQLQEKTNELTNQLNAALSEYTVLKNEYDQLPDGPEKLQKLQELNAAQEKVERIKAELAAALNEQSAFVKRYADVLKNALRELRAEHLAIIERLKPIIDRLFPPANEADVQEEGVEVEAGDFPDMPTETSPADDENSRTVLEFDKSVIYKTVSVYWNSPEGLLDVLKILQQVKAPSFIYEQADEGSQIKVMKQLLELCTVEELRKRAAGNPHLQRVVEMATRLFDPGL